MVSHPWKNTNCSGILVAFSTIIPDRFIAFLLQVNIDAEILFKHLQSIKSYKFVVGGRIEEIVLWKSIYHSFILPPNFFHWNVSQDYYTSQYLILVLKVTDVQRL